MGRRAGTRDTVELELASWLLIGAVDDATTA
jgi:hypothetical protein